MSNKIAGNITHILQPESGTSQKGTWQKRTIVIETVDEKYPKSVAVQLWGDLVDSGLAVGDSVTVHINIESREYKERWYTDVRAWKVDVESKATVTEPIVHAVDDEDSLLPF